MTDNANHRARTRSIVLLIMAEIAAMSLWFVSAAILGDMAREADLSTGTQAAMSASVQGGFVIGALLSALFGLADRYEPRYVLSLFALLAAIANALLLIAPPGSGASILLRGLTGACLAGVYPVGMKIAVGWSQRSRGLLVGLLVGGLTLGSAAPHLLSYLGGTDWRITVIAASALSLLAAVLILKTENGPYHSKQTKFDISALAQAWTNPSIRRAYGGYLGHMWELYSMWAWIAVALAVSFASQLPQNEADQLAKLVTFIVIGLGAVSCPLAGYIADRIGKAELTILAMAISGSSALLFALTFGDNIWLTIAIAAIWGITIIPDSAQFSALVADYAEPAKAGSLMTLQTALGFALTTITVQLSPWVAAQVGWPVLMATLALGPAFGIYSMWQLQRKFQTTDRLPTQ